MKALFVLLFMIAYGFTQWHWITIWVIVLIVSEFTTVLRWYINNAH